MNLVPNAFINLPAAISSLNEPDSYDFLSQAILLKNWDIYSSRKLWNNHNPAKANFDIDTVFSLAATFCSHHGRIPLPGDPHSTFQSLDPLLSFRYKMLEPEESFDFKGQFRTHKWDYIPIRTMTEFDFIVEGLYWTNGYCYIVRSATYKNFSDPDKTLNSNYNYDVLEVFLAIDSNTITFGKYPLGYLTLEEYFLYV